MTDQINSITRQWVAVKFKPEDGRSYTYHNDADPVVIGDKVVVPNRGGTSPAEVVGLPLEPPPFATKAIIGKAPPPADPVHDQAKADAAASASRTGFRSR